MDFEVADPRFHDIVDTSQQRISLADGFQFTEGPIWHPYERHVTFSDIPADSMHRWSEEAGVSIYRSPSHNANGNTYDKQGRILTCEHATSRIVREELDGSISVLASHWDGKELNSPNDIVVRSNGDIFFTDPIFGRGPGVGIERPLELDFRGVYKINGNSGELTLLAKDFTQPNGLAFTVDESHLLVADTPERHIRKFACADDGTLSGGEVFARSTGDKPGAPDGLKVATSGHVFCAGPGGVHVYAPESGDLLGIFLTPKFCANFTWGGDDMKTFFMTSTNDFYSVRTKVQGNSLL